MTTHCAPACSQVLPVQPKGVWARGVEAWTGPKLELRRWGSSGPSSLMVDYYITIFFIEKPWQALNIAMLRLYYVQMWKWIVMIFLCDIFSGAGGMLKWLRNHRQSQQPTGRNGGLPGANAEKRWSLNRLQLSLYQQAGGIRSKYNSGDIRGWRNSKRIELLSSDDPTSGSQIGWAVHRECNTRMRDPKCGRDCEHRRRCDSR